MADKFNVGRVFIVGGELFPGRTRHSQLTPEPDRCCMCQSLHQSMDVAERLVGSLSFADGRTGNEQRCVRCGKYTLFGEQHASSDPSRLDI